MVDSHVASLEVVCLFVLFFETSFSFHIYVNLFVHSEVREGFKNKPKMITFLEFRGRLEKTNREQLESD